MLTWQIFFGDTALFSRLQDRNSFNYYDWNIQSDESLFAPSLSHVLKEQQLIKECIN
jgi:hypothetical protein